MKLSAWAAARAKSAGEIPASKRDSARRRASGALACSTKADQCSFSRSSDFSSRAREYAMPARIRRVSSSPSSGGCPFQRSPSRFSSSAAALAQSCCFQATSARASIASARGVLAQDLQRLVVPPELGQRPRLDHPPARIQRRRQQGGARGPDRLQRILRPVVHQVDHRQVGRHLAPRHPVEPVVHLVLQQLGGLVEQVHVHQPARHAPDHLVPVGADRRQLAEVGEQGQRLDRLQGIGAAVEEQVLERLAQVGLQLLRPPAGRELRRPPARIASSASR